MIKIICVGKIKEKFYREATIEYIKRLTKYTKIDIIELLDEPIDNSLIALTKEKNKILSKIKEKDYVFTLEIEGNQLCSIDFAEKIRTTLITNPDIVFVIGSSHGLHDDVKKRSNYNLSFSKLTFPHQLFRVILLEQIYRIYKINNKESYHK